MSIFNFSVCKIHVFTVKRLACMNTAWNMHNRRTITWSNSAEETLWNFYAHVMWNSALTTSVACKGFRATITGMRQQELLHLEFRVKFLPLFSFSQKMCNSLHLDGVFTPALRGKSVRDYYSNWVLVHVRGATKKLKIIFKLIFKKIS